MKKTIEIKEPVDLLIQGGIVVKPGYTGPQWIAVNGGKVVALGNTETVPSAKQTIDASGKHILPGAVDNELHPVPPLTGSFVTKEPMAEVVFAESRASLVGGITTVGIQLTTNLWDKSLRDIGSRSFARDEIPNMIEAFPKFLEMMARSCCDYFLTPMIRTDEQAREVPELAERHGVTSYKMSLQSMRGEHIRNMWPLVEGLGYYYFDDGTIYLAMKNVAAIGLPGRLAFHAENWEIARIIKDELLAQGRTDVAAWDEKSPPFVEAGHVRNYAYYARVTGCPICIQHVTTPQTVEEVLRAKAEGVNIFGNTSPQYLTLDKDVWRTNVPLRSREAIDMCWEALRIGAIDTVSTDNCTADVRPLAEVEKYGLEYKHNVLSYWDGGMGGRGEALFPVMLSEGVNKGRISLERLVDVCCENPARYFGLYPKKGVISVGSDADLVIVDLNKTKTLTRDMLHSFIPWSIWEGWEIKGWPVVVILRGNIVMEWPEGQVRAEVTDKAIGRYLARKPGRELYPLD